MPMITHAKKAPLHTMVVRLGSNAKKRDAGKSQRMLSARMAARRGKARSAPWQQRPHWRCSIAVCLLCRTSIGRAAPRKQAGRMTIEEPAVIVFLRADGPLAVRSTAKAPKTPRGLGGGVRVSL